MGIYNNGGNLSQYSSSIARRLGVLIAGDEDLYAVKDQTTQSKILGAIGDVAKSAVIGSLGVPGIVASALVDRVQGEIAKKENQERDYGHWMKGIEELAKQGVPGYIYTTIQGPDGQKLEVAADASSLVDDPGNTPNVIIRGNVDPKDPEIQASVQGVSNAAASSALGFSQEEEIKRSNHAASIEEYNVRFDKYVTAANKGKSTEGMNPGVPPTEPVPASIALASQVAKVYEEVREERKPVVENDGPGVSKEDVSASLPAPSLAPL